MENEIQEKLEKEIERFYEKFDEDADNLYQEEYQLMIKGKHKNLLKYPESFYDHWKKELKGLVEKQHKHTQKEILKLIKSYKNQLVKHSSSWDILDKIEQEIKGAKD